MVDPMARCGQLLLHELTAGVCGGYAGGGCAGVTDGEHGAVYRDEASVSMWRFCLASPMGRGVSGHNAMKRHVSSGLVFGEA